jgi:hypothetical protein
MPMFFVMPSSNRDISRPSNEVALCDMEALIVNQAERSFFA